MFDTRRIPHAILIDGPHGAGKKSLARIISAAAVCESQGELPCGECRQCKNALGGTHPDISLFTGTGTGSRSFGVDAVRKIRLDAFVSPNDAARKVYILANIQDMTEQAQNALLKILEEPPASVLFILTCDSRSHILETVRSRAQVITAGAITENEAVRALEAQCNGISGEEALRAARVSGGIVGRAKLMLDEGFAEISDFTSAFTKALCCGRYLRVFEPVRQAGERRRAFYLLLRFFARPYARRYFGTQRRNRKPFGLRKRSPRPFAQRRREKSLQIRTHGA